MSTGDGGAAFPTGTTSYGGLTMRDYFAAKALPVAFAAYEAGYWEADVNSLNDELAECAYQMADAMLKARDKG